LGGPTAKKFGTFVLPWIFLVDLWKPFSSQLH
jgi:hypothetical protein